MSLGAFISSAASAASEVGKAVAAVGKSALEGISKVGKTGADVSKSALEGMSEVGKTGAELGKSALEGIKEVKPVSAIRQEFPDMFERPDNTDAKPSNFETVDNRRGYDTSTNWDSGVPDKTGRYYDDKGELYRVNDELVPNNRYEINGYKYETDEKGRISSAEGELHLKDREGRLPVRDSIEDIGKGDQRDGDDRGHLIGDQFDGSNGLENMIPQDSEVNRNDFRNFENKLAEEVKSGKNVSVKVEPIYEGDSHRPSDIGVTYNINGKENIRIFPNSKEDL